MDSGEQLRVFPLSGWTVNLLASAEVLVEFRIIPHADAFTTGERHVVPIRMLVEQARELANVLNRAAEAAEASQLPGQAPN